MPDPRPQSADSMVDSDEMQDSVAELNGDGEESELGIDAVVLNAAPVLSENLHENPYILLITDDKPFGEQITQSLDRLHYRTAMIYTTDTAAAISRCAAERPDMAILNVDALSLGGIGLSRRLKADTPHLKVLSIVHGRELQAALKESEVSGADAVCGLLDLPLQLQPLISELLARRVAEKEAAVTETSLTLQDRIRVEASVFDFSALLDGVRTDEDPPFQVPEVEPAVAEAESAIAFAERQPHAVLVREPHPVRPKLQRSTRPMVVAFLAVAAVVATILVLNTGVLQSDNAFGRGSASPGKPDINLTARKGLPFPPLTPGDRADAPRKPAKIDDAIARGVFEAYGLSELAAQDYVLVRLIPAGLGGTENPRNLFPTTPWFADLKARLDKRLIQLYESGGLSIDQAEAELKDNWVRTTHRYYIRNYGIDDPDAARKEEEKNKW